MNNFSVQKANKFIEENKGKINQLYVPDFHLSPEVGWMNDPNGFSYFNDKYHMFYQFYPYESKWGPMHWGHARSKDGIKWEHLDIALAPDQPYDEGGCFSGSAIEKDGKLYLMYTGHLPNEMDESLTRQNQNIAISSDGITFEKYKNNPVLTELDVPDGSSIVDFRDPKIFEKDGEFYSVIGSKTIKDEGQVLLYKSEDLLKWEFVSVFFPHNKFLGTMVECPDFIIIDEKEYFVLSAMNYTDEETGKFYPHISWVIEGQVDWNNFIFEMDNVKEMDRGLDFYAPQTVKNGNQYIAIAWMQGWGRTIPSHEQKHGWAGQLTLPRILEHTNNKLRQKVHPNIKNYLKNKETVHNMKIADKYTITDESVQYINIRANYEHLDDFSLKFSNAINEHVYLYYDKFDKTFYFSRKDANEKIVNDENIELNFSAKTYPHSENEMNLEIFIDVSSIEFFINDDSTLSNTYYFNEPISKIAVESKNTINIEEVSTANIDLDM